MYLWRRVEQDTGPPCLETGGGVATRVVHYEMADGRVNWGNAIGSSPDVSPYANDNPPVEAFCLGAVTHHLRSSDDGPELQKLAATGFTP